MKRLILILCIPVMHGVTFAQNTNPWPSSGNVGIGTTTPNTPIHIVGGNAMTAGWNRTSTLQATFPVQIFNSNSSKWAGIGYDYSAAMRFWINASSDDVNGTGLAALNLLNNGNLGIGTFTPVSRLVVSNGGANGLEINPVTGLNDGTDIISYNRSNAIYTPLQLVAKEYSIGTSSVSNAMFIAQSGNIGIGTATPQVAGTGYTGLDIRGGNAGASLILGTNSLPTYLYSNGAHFSIENTGFQAFRAGSTERMRITSTGDIGIGTSTPDSKLTVAGKIHAQEVKVSVNAGADFVFDKEYELQGLEELERFIKANKHLPEITSANEMKKNGIQLGAMNIKLLQKIEELTLHLIDQHKQLQAQQLQLKSQSEALQKQQLRIAKLEELRK